MGASRIRTDKDKSELIQALVAGDGTGPFLTYADAIAFAAALGYYHHKRVPLTVISKNEPAPINLEIFTSRGYEALFKLLAMADTQDPKILSALDSHNEHRRLEIFEEYANGGLEVLREELRGAVDYTERLLLLLGAERLHNQSSPEDFDLTRFL